MVFVVFYRTTVLYYDKNEDYHPNQIKGDWLQLKWGNWNGKGWKYGWIMWKKQKKLLIELYYF